MRGENIRIVAIGILVTAMLLWGCPMWLHRDAWYISLAHHFFHVNLFHLAVNCFSMWTLFRKGMRYSAWALAVPFFCATLSWFASPLDPVGASNFLFAVIGCRTPRLRSRWWRQSSTIVFFLGMLVMAFVPGISFITHLVSFILGCLFAILFRYIAKVNRDVKSAGNR